MFTPSQSSAARRAPRERRGVALVFVLIFTVAMAALAMASIFLTSNSNLLAKSYNRERDLKYAADAALAIGKARVNADPTILTMRAGQVDTAILLNQQIIGANNKPIPGITVNVYVGPSGSTSGQFGRFSSIVAEARDGTSSSLVRNGFIRRLELVQESFAKFAYWSNSESNGSTTIFFNNGDELWGPVWSNDTISIGTGRATFHDDVGTTFFISGVSNGTFSKGYKQYQPAIPLPSTSQLNVLSTIASTSGWNFTSGRAASQNESSVLDRIEFIATDLNNNGDSLQTDEGLFRVFTANSDALLRGDYTGTNVSNAKFCGDWHWVRSGGAAGTDTTMFFPASVHNTAWFNALVFQGLRDQSVGTGPATTQANNEQAASLSTIMGHSGARCYLPGDPHLVAVERTSAYTDPKTGVGYTNAAIQKGGMDTTFTPVGTSGSWKANPATVNATIAAVRGTATSAGRQNIGDAGYVFPLDRAYNTNAKGVIRFSGNVGISGTLNGRVTMIADGSIIILDDLRYANDPVYGRCVNGDILGLISRKDIVIADNALNTPQSNGSATQNMDDTKDMYIHGVMMALGTSFRVENYGSGPTHVNDCDVTNNGRGCIYLSGGLIQNSRGAVGTSGGTGFAKRYSYDHCVINNPPPYFPTTGRFTDNRYLELDPAGFNHTQYFLSLVP